MKTFFLLSFFFPLLFSLQTFSQSNGVHQHDGFYLRLAGGFGYAQLTEEVMNLDIELSGFGGSSRIQIGGTVSENLILYGELGGVVVYNPDLKFAGETFDTDDTQMIVSDFGGGLTYYFMPTNIYLAFSALLSQATLEVDGDRSTSEIGFGLNAMAGKEWWVGDDWGIGATVYIYYSTMSDEGCSDCTINNFSVGVLFSATYN
jgi:hypothetical protein